VAAYPEFHPQAPAPTRDLENFRRKVEAGADAAITQYFYNADAYFGFVDAAEARGRDPVMPGIMPITNYTQLARFSDACGAEIPAGCGAPGGLRGRPRVLRAFGHEVVLRLCRRLLEGGGLHFYTMGGPTLHFYTMNQASGPPGPHIEKGSARKLWGAGSRDTP
jgi:methylenetetrahydrofolate reductase (NADPH)